MIGVKFHVGVADFEGGRKGISPECFGSYSGLSLTHRGGPPLGCLLVAATSHEVGMFPGVVLLVEQLLRVSTA